MDAGVEPTRMYLPRVQHGSTSQRGPGNGGKTGV